MSDKNQTLLKDSLLRKETVTKPDSRSGGEKESNLEIKPPRKIFYFVVPLISIFFTLGAVELGLALFHPVPFSFERNMYYEADPHTGFRIRPHSLGHFRGGIVALANSHGHRDDEVTLEKSPDTFRVLLLGDSFSMGANVRQEDAYPQALEKLLNEESNRKIEIVNSGVGGWDPFQYAQYYEHYGWRFNPDLILVGFFVGNDAYNDRASVEDVSTAIMGRRVTRDAAASRFINLKVFLYDNFNLARLAINKGPVKGGKSRKDCEDFTDHYLSIQKTRMPIHLKRTDELYDRAQNCVYQIARIKELADRRAIPVEVVLIPDENQINPALQQAVIGEGDRSLYDFGMPQSMLAEMFAGSGIKTIDLLPAFLEESRCLYMNDTHWTEEGHHLAAEIIRSELEGRVP